MEKEPKTANSRDFGDKGFSSCNVESYGIRRRNSTKHRVPLTSVSTLCSTLSSHAKTTPPLFTFVFDEATLVDSPLVGSDRSKWN